METRYSFRLKASLNISAVTLKRPFSFSQTNPQPTELVTENLAPRIDAKFSPDGQIVSFIRHNDLWIQDIATGKELRLTHSNPTDSPTCKKGSGIAECTRQVFLAKTVPT